MATLTECYQAQEVLIKARLHNAKMHKSQKDINILEDVVHQVLGQALQNHYAAQQYLKN